VDGLYLPLVARNVARPRDVLTLVRIWFSTTRLVRAVAPRRDPVQIQMKSMSTPIFLRPGTTDYDVFKEIFRRGDYDGVRPLVGRSPRVVVDLGANIGLAARWFLAQWPDVQIVAVEPEPANISLLRSNLDVTGAHVSVHPVCAGASERTALLASSEGAWAFRLMSKDVGAQPSQPIEVKVQTLDTILEESGVDGDIDLLKCDIEGAERELFESCESWIGRVRSMVVECHDGYTAYDLLGDLEKNNVRFHLVGVVKPIPTIEVALLTRSEG